MNTTLLDLLTEMGADRLQRGILQGREIVLDLAGFDNDFLTRPSYDLVVASLASANGPLGRRSLVSLLAAQSEFIDAYNPLGQLNVALAVLGELVVDDGVFLSPSPNFATLANGRWEAVEKPELEGHNLSDDVVDNWPSYEHLVANEGNLSKFHQNLLERRRAMESLPPGLNKHEIAKRLDMSVVAVENTARWMGYELTRRRNNQKKIDEAEAAFSRLPEGLTREEVAEQLGMTYANAAHWGKVVGYEFKRKTKH